MGGSVGALLGPERRLLGAGIVLGSIGALGTLSPFIGIAELGRTLVRSGPVPAAGVAVIALGIAVGLTVGWLATGAALWLTHIADHRLQSRLKRALVDKLGRVPLGWYSDTTSGAVRKAVQSDLAELHYLVAHHAVDLAGALVLPAGGIAYLLWLDWRLALLAVATLPVYGIAYAWMMWGFAGKMAALDESFAAVGAPPRRPARFREMRVLRTAHLTPKMRRLTLTGQNLGRFAAGGLHLKILIPPAGVTAPDWPVVGRDGLPRWPEGDRCPILRTYTIRRVDVAAGELDIDVVLHEGDSVGSGWARQARPGDVIGIGGPGGGTPAPADWYLLAGDETALPGIARILETLPADARGAAFVEVADAAEEQAIDRPAGVSLRWLHRNGAAAGTTTLLEDAVRTVDWPSGGDVFAWVGCEFQAFKAIRAFLRDDCGLKKGEHLVVAYWRRGLSEGETPRRA